MTLRNKRSVSLKTAHKKRHRFRYLVYALLLWGMVVVVVFLSCYKVTRITNYGMLPTLNKGDVVIVKKGSDVKRHDLVLVNRGTKKHMVLRVIGLPGEKVTHVRDQLFINDQPVDEKYLVDKVNEATAHGGQVTKDMALSDLGDKAVVPEDCFVLLGDNRPYSNDSRTYGYITKQQLVGKVTSIW